MIMVTAHSLGLWGVWLYQGQWLKEAFDQGDRINNLAGGVSFLSGLALWLSSLEVARRSSYEVFYKLHHIGKSKLHDNVYNLYASMFDGHATIGYMLPPAGKKKLVARSNLAGGVSYLRGFV